MIKRTVETSPSGISPAAFPTYARARIEHLREYIAHVRANPRTLDPVGKVAWAESEIIKLQTSTTTGVKP